MPVTLSSVTDLPRVWIPANEMVNTVATPSRGDHGDVYSIWQMDAAAVEALSSSVVVSPGWTTFRVDLYWSNFGAGSGNVRWTATHAARGDAGALTTSDGSASVTVAAPAQDVLAVTTVFASVTATTTGPTWLRIQREATDVADTLANDASVLGLLLVRLT